MFLTFLLVLLTSFVLQFSPTCPHLHHKAHFFPSYGLNQCHRLCRSSLGAINANITKYIALRYLVEMERQKAGKRYFLQKWWATLILMSLSDSFFCFSASFRLRLSSSRRFRFSSSRCLFFSSSLLLLSSLFSSLILWWKRDAQKMISLFVSALACTTVLLSHLFFDFLIFDVLQERCCSFG